MSVVDIVLHIDKHLSSAIQQLGSLSYVILFAIIFAETGLVVVPFLPGDSLLFAAGALSGSGMLKLGVVLPVLAAAAIIGDSLNYWLGSVIGPRVFARENARFFNPQHLQQTHDFFAKYGAKTIILARFVPIVRTFAPFVAGVGNMRYSTFLVYNVIGGALWVTIMTLLGYFFGSIPVIKHNFEYVVILIVLLSVVPAAVEYFRHRHSVTPSAKDSANLSDIKETFKKEGLND